MISRKFGGNPPPVPHTYTREELAARGVHIVVAVPPPPTIESETELYLWNIARAGWPRMPLGAGAAETHRNHIAAMLLKDPDYSQYTHVCMLDADQVHPPNVVERLARWVIQDPDRWVVAGLYYKRASTHEPLFRTYHADGDFKRAITWPARTLFRVGTVGTGIMLVNRKVFEHLQWPFFQYKYRPLDAWQPGTDIMEYSEDTHFCLQCFKAGIGVYLDPTTESPHVAQQVITDAHFRFMLEKHPELFPEGRPVRAATTF